MKIASRYELLEPVTTGAVDVFVAHDDDTKLRRLVFFLAAGNAASRPSTREILERFRTLAPDPPGVILDVGLDQASARLYLVTSFPSDPLAMQDWIHAYRSFSASGQPDSHSSATNAEGTTSSGFAVGAVLAPPEGPQHNRGVSTSQIQMGQASDRQNPGEFTRMFRPSSQPAAPPSQISAEGLGPSPGAGRDEVSSPSLSVPASSEPAPQPTTGEFTRFFRAGSSEQPARLPVLDEPTPETQRGPGEFTRVFGSPSTPAPEPASAGLGDDLFRSGQPVEHAPSAPTEATSLPPQSRGPVGDAQSHAAEANTDFSRPLAFEASGKASRNPIASQAGPPSAIPEPMWDRPSVPPLKARTSPAAPSISLPSSQPTAAGPSEYTRIVSGGLGNRTPSAEPPPPSPPPVLPALGGGPPPQPTVPVPSVSPTPPPATAPAAPAGPAPPAAPALSAQAPSKLPLYWPLVVILNVLLVAAIALVIYFALKPR